LDGWMDVYVANDMLPNHMWINQRDGSFVNDGLLGGTAVNADGRSESSMGVDAADFDDDGDEDLFMTHLGYQTNTLYINDGKGLFDDRTTTSGLGPPSVGRTSWGVRFFDYDNDGLLDLMTASGDVFVIEALARQNEPFPMHQPNQLFRNTGSGRFEDVTATAGSVFELSEVSRGLAFGDVDNDGDTDVLVENCNGRARLLVNTVGSANHWLGLRLVAGAPPVDQIGAWVGVHRKGRPTMWRRVRTDGGFASANDPRLLFGLGDGTSVDRVEVHWPDGTAEEWTDLAVDRYSTLTRGGGVKAKSEGSGP
ncbi:MAG: CRTAC1 family protein, partial [Acidobacteria bacterium]|nr:CRTAC1 family protein [Candidatus Sulfomarinibacter kjeldsenii]